MDLLKASRNSFSSSLAHFDSNSPYTYRPLKSPSNFRLLHILPKSKPENLQFYLCESEIDESKDYHAVSYAWGAPIFNRRIYSAQGFLDITESLFEALLQLRHRREYGLPGLLWIDAICINQQDLDERSQQILLMDKIFGRSNPACVWLGPETAMDGRIFGFIRRFADDYWTLVEEVCDSEEGMNAVFDQILASDPDNHDNCEALTKLLERSWFLRAWTFQEMISAPKAFVFSGQQSINLSYLMTFGTLWVFLQLKTKLLSRESQLAVGQLALAFRVINGLSDESQSNAYCSLLSLASTIRTRQATDPRDKLYSVVPLATDQESLPYSPTYKVDTEVLYRDFAAHVITRRNNLDIFNSCFYDSCSDLPTWVPDWSTQLVAHYPLEPKHSEFHASGYYTQTTIAEAKGKILIVKASILEQVEQLSDSKLHLGDNYLQDYYESYVSMVRNQQQAAQSLSSMVASSSLYANEESQREAFWRAFLGESNTNDQLSAELERKVQQFCTNLDSIIANEIDLAHFNAQAYGATEERLVHNASGRKICLTHTGRVGWVPGAARVGDSVGLVLGSAVPILLRQEGDSYLMIGQCYIHGIMGGEGMNGCDTQFESLQLV